MADVHEVSGFVLPADAPLVAVRRGSLVESHHRGRIAVCDPAGEILDSIGDPDGLHGNCSGKHAGMLAVCIHEGWDTVTYIDPDHPLQRWISALVSRVCSIEPGSLIVGGDGCGLPAFAMPLRGLATGFARLATGQHLPDDLSAAALRIRDAMRTHPFMVAGTGRLDTELMEVTHLVTKMGAEGMLAAGSPDRWGMAIKISDGAGRAVRPAALSALLRRGAALLESDPIVVRDLHGVEVGIMDAVPQNDR